MPRRPAVLLTPLRDIPNLSLSCTSLQKSEAHPLAFQSFPRSLQKHRGCHQKHFSISCSPRGAFNSSLFLALSLEGCTLLHQSEVHLLYFQSLLHSLCVYPGWRPERFLRFWSGSPQPSNLRPFQLSNALSPSSATLTAKHRDLTEISRNWSPASPLESTLTDFTSVTPLSATLTRNRGGGASC